MVNIVWELVVGRRGEDVRTVPGPTPAMIAKGLEAILIIGEFALKQEKN